MCEADGRITSGLVFVPVQLNVFDDIGINHLPMNSGVGSLNSLWLPLHMYCGDIVIHVVYIVGYSYTCRMYCVGYSYTCSMYCGDIVIHVVCIVGIQLYM